ncbi:MAG: DEAD/DEAH box helicase [Prevotella sp.]|nr:DEAD/DEAH box helicase [Prevotella sp.]
MMLRDYQQEMIGRLMRAWKKHRSVMVQMPTGTGKTVLLAEVIKQSIIHHAQCTNKEQGVLIVAHRRELLEQIRGTVRYFGIDMEKNHIVVESIQKLSRDLDYTTFEPSLIIIDEAHHALAKTYRILWERWPKARFLGLTATPCRLNGAAFTDLFDVLLQSWSIQSFIDKGWLSDFEYVSASPDSQALRQVRQLRKRGADGDYQTKELVTVMDVPESVEHLYKTYQRFANGKKGIVYAIDRQHAQHIAECYQSHGVSCAVIDSKTPADERERIVEQYKETSTHGGASPVQVLVNVDIFSEGFDCPEMAFIQLARPTLSLSKYMQQVGRGMRVSKGKPYVLILDNVGLYQTFGLPTEERDWQKMFFGKATGIGHQERIVLVDDPDNRVDPELVNLEMVRIKKGGRKGAGLEVFLQGSLYGVMLNGKVTCPARFKEMIRVDKKSRFFALAIFTEVQRSTSKGLYMSCQFTDDIMTVIDKKGKDMGARLYGDTHEIDGDFVYGERVYENGELSPCWWDSKTGNYYSYRPELRVIHGMNFACNGRKGKFRFVTGLVNPKLSLPDLYFNRHIALDKFYLVVRNDHNHAYNICGYLNDSVIVQNDASYGYLQILNDGTKGETYVRLPKGMTHVLDDKQLRVKKIGDKPFV